MTDVCDLRKNLWRKKSRSLLKEKNICIITNSRYATFCGAPNDGQTTIRFIVSREIHLVFAPIYQDSAKK